MDKPNAAVALEIAKSSRHSKITGDFAEGLILYWLSKHGFECARVDHTGMDLIARNPHTKELMGISVKARSRSAGAEGTHVKIERDNDAKLTRACEAFGCVPYFAIVVDAGQHIRCFIIALEYLDVLSAGGKHFNLKMTSSALAKHYADDRIIVFEFQSKTLRWWKPPSD